MLTVRFKSPVAVEPLMVAACVPKPLTVRSDSPLKFTILMPPEARDVSVVTFPSVMPVVFKLTVSTLAVVTVPMVFAKPLSAAVVARLIVKESSVPDASAKLVVTASAE